MRNALILLAAIAVCLGIAGTLYVASRPAATPVPQVQQQAQQRTVELAGQTVRVTIADTDAAREKGLGGRTGLAADEGMLFVFPDDGKYAFWMKDMKFSIDMVWLSATGTVAYMAQNVSPSTYPNAFSPSSPARYVLELPAGWAKEYNVHVGDLARL